MVEWFFQSTPLWLILLLLFAAMVGACECGVRLRRRMRESGAAEAADKQAENYVFSGMFGLLALLVAFTFGMALNRFDVRRDLVVQEANALGTAYLRTAILDDAGALRGMMRRYGQARLTFGLNGGAEGRAAEQRAEQLEPMIWAEAVRLIRPNRQTGTPLFVMGPINETFDAATARRTALAARIPGDVLATLVIYMVMSAALLGSAVVKARRGLRILTYALFALFALAFGVILDLDEPRKGPIRVPQAAMAETVRMMSAAEPPPKAGP